MKERINAALISIYEFIRNPFDKPLTDFEKDKDLVFAASLLAVGIAIVRFLCAPRIDGYAFVFLLSSIALSPVFGLLTVHFRGAIFGLYLHFIARPLFKVTSSNFLFSKQIVTFSTIGLIVAAIPSLNNIGLVIVFIIQAIGLVRLFKIEILKSVLIALLYNAFWVGLILLIAKSTTWM